MPSGELKSEDLVSIGLSEAKAKETLKNGPLSATLMEVINMAKPICGEIGRKRGMLLYALATRIKAQCRNQLARVVTAIAKDEIVNEPQLAGSLEFLLAHSASTFTPAEFRTASGIGIVVTHDQIEDTLEFDHRLKRLSGEIRGQLKWADGAAVKQEVDVQILCLLGPKSVDELLGRDVPVKGNKFADGKGSSAGKAKDSSSTGNQKKSGKYDADAEENADGADTIEELMRNKVNFHKPGENYTTEGYIVTSDTKRLLAEHLKRTGGKVITRFPPEPNGVLHIGHAKAINIDFGYAKAFGGSCNLRYDDTNPEKEEEKFFVAIKDMVEWLGYKPACITHSSDNFQQLYEWAVQLIEKGLAYVCHQRPEEMRGFNPVPSPWRNRPIKESLQLFDDMKNGKIEEGEATLRMKTTLEEGKQDPVAYRIKFVTHHRTGDKWCIYPTYDYTHCLCDSIEDITHSLCTKEFQSRRSSYYWLCNAVGVYSPVQWEYGRLNMTYTVVSKRKIGKLITEGIVNDWDDPRLFTLTALRRRGIPAEAINSFVARMGVSMAKVSIDPGNLDSHVRDVLNQSAKRAMGILDPLKVRIDDKSWSKEAWDRSFTVPDFPAEPTRGEHRVKFGRQFYIEQSDFVQGEAEKGFKRLTENQSVGLKYLSAVIKVQKVIKDSSGRPAELVVRIEALSNENKPKGFIQWIADPVQVEIRLYDRLFFHKNPEDPAEVPGGFVSDCNKDSLTVISNGMVDESIRGSKVYDRFQLERIGFFSVDTDSTPEKIVLNRTVLLREDTGKTK